MLFRHPLRGEGGLLRAREGAGEGALRDLDGVGISSTVVSSYFLAVKNSHEARSRVARVRRSFRSRRPAAGPDAADHPAVTSCPRFPPFTNSASM
ncbi:hypothetical protein RND61_22905 [Streptomyces sp. TRM76323]|uniref:Uncharacterized protein n=1 Tax=Streptomyces tamarix TaxID=3078565 RepID=A0ABU3QQ40_9ACTN|nr:hypothetical protein [Streptomyces tamarix]MDT9684886.1 hypothetical protein [Streptomyces tamarix]